MSELAKIFDLEVTAVLRIIATGGSDCVGRESKPGPLRGRERFLIPDVTLLPFQVRVLKNFMKNIDSVGGLVVKYVVLTRECGDTFIQSL